MPWLDAMLVMKVPDFVGSGPCEIFKDLSAGGMEWTFYYPNCWDEELFQVSRWDRIGHGPGTG